MESTRWICIQLKEKHQKLDWYNENTLCFTRKESKKYLLEGSSFGWEEWYKNGWRCIKVKVTINPI